jgi:predicted amidohydrolase
MRIAVVQLTSEPGGVEANVAAHAALVEEARRQGARVVVFPELSLSGYDLDAIARDATLTLDADDGRLRPLVEACREADALAVVGAPVARAGKRLLCAVVVGPGGVGEVYAKRHVHADEAGVFDPGDRDVVLEVDGRRLGLAICFDSAHPEHAGRCRAAGADAYLVGAMFLDGEERMLAERMAERARGFGLWVALAQHSGPTGDGPACGGSGVWAPDGRPVVRLGRESPAVAVAELP